jgi:hypothetical protein
MDAKTGREQRAFPTNTGEVIYRMEWLDGHARDGDILQEKP